jgi:hypothetical protein
MLVNGQIKNIIPKRTLVMRYVKLFVMVLLYMGITPAYADDIERRLSDVITHFVTATGSRSDGKPWRLYVDPLVEKESHYPSVASEFLRWKIEDLAQSHFQLVSRDSLDVAIAEGEADEAQRDDYNNEEFLVAYLGCDFRLRGEYTVSGNHLDVRFILSNQHTTERHTQTKRFRLKNNKLDGRSTTPNIPPQEQKQIQVMQAAQWHDFEIEIRPHRGDGATYKGGEFVYLQFRASRNCYLRLYHIDVDGTMSYLFPNPLTGDNWIQAGKTYRLPSESYGRKWRVSEKDGALFGVEKIKAVASSQPFTHVPTERSIGKYDSDKFRSVIMRGALTRSMEDVVNPTTDPLTAEAFCIYRTEK